MRNLIEKYANKLVEHGLCHNEAPIVGGINDEIFWNRSSKHTKELEKIINGLNINSLIFAKPIFPFMEILNFHSSNTDYEFVPEDTETRTFLHSIPVVRELKAETIIPFLKKRKGVVIENEGIITFGTVSPEQAFVVFSSIIFSAFVKFFVDYAYLKLKNESNEKMEELFPNILKQYLEFLPKETNFNLFKGKLSKEAEIINAMKEAGKAVVDARMVDSFFGNISFRNEDTIYISQTGSSMDELSGCIDACPIDETATTAITASSEFVAHKEIYLNNNINAILHGHPKFSVIMSMICDDFECELRGKCHIKCPKERFIDEYPIIPGEVGTGPKGISKTLPPAMKDRKGVIVYGHGVFTTGKDNFTEAFNTMSKIEKMCLDKYLKIVNNRNL
jgi:ribulose-5-phosphate 4-epimerase/fuculose-1-phosphate aldolase